MTEKRNIKLKDKLYHFTGAALMTAVLKRCFKNPVTGIAVTVFLVIMWEFIQFLTDSNYSILDGLFDMLANFGGIGMGAGL